MTTRYQSCLTTEGSHLHIEDDPHGHHRVVARRSSNLHMRERSNLSGDGIPPQVVSILAVELQGVRDILWNLNTDLVAVILLPSPRGSYPAVRLAQHVWCPLGEGLLS